MSKGYAVTNPATNEVVETFDTFTDEQIQYRRADPGCTSQVSRGLSNLA